MAVVNDATNADAQVPLPGTAADVPRPALGNIMTGSYVEMTGRMAYISVGHSAMLTDYVKPDQDFIVCPNQDVVYGSAFAALDSEPMVFQVPDFGDRFWVYALYDARTDEFAQIGKQYGTAPGFYLIVGPNWTGDAPAGITAVVHCPTELAFAVPRVFKDDTAEDTEAIQAQLNQIAFYPLSEFDGATRITDWRKLPVFPVRASTGGEHKFVDPEAFYDQLPDVMALVPPLPGEEALYGWISSVWDAAARDPKTKQTLVDALVAADNDIVAELFQFVYNGKPIGNGWTAPANASRWGTDYLNRTAVSKSSMFQNTPEETQYQFKEHDSDGEPLSGGHQYTVTFPQGKLPPVRGFWSLTVYNAIHFFEPNPMNRYSLGTKNKSLQYGDDGSLTLYLGAKSPGEDKAANWIPTPAGTFSLLLRNYWPEQAIIDGTWVPPDVQKAH